MYVCMYMIIHCTKIEVMRTLGVVNIIACISEQKIFKIM